ncbi:hypothetical protein [Bordetella hinzii]|uniref:hypothetical protein n=1 Tax=Bordetella hinzii TaxID=103855 RepID=UPI00114F6A91|nr:hypothetical protein [Bordetella hinzii]QDJ52836.1 hypothetical protein CBR69_22205 [Bordetella hinzii]
MTKPPQILGRDVYVRLTDPSGACSEVINHHRAWDTDRLMASLVQQYDTDAKPEERRLVSRATPADYRRFRNYKVN